MEKLLEKWDEGNCPILNGVVSESGNIVYLEIDREEEYKEFVVKQIGYGSLAQFFQVTSNRFTAATEFCSLSLPEKGCRVSAGGGSWGGDGYVVLIDLKNERIIWLASFENSNEFEKLGIKDEVIIAETNLQDTWEFPLNSPEDVKVYPFESAL